MKHLTVARVALLFIGLMVGWALLGGLAGILMTHVADRSEAPEPVTARQATTPAPPAPRLEVGLLEARRAAVGPEQRARTGGPDHIPVEEAMRRLAASGWPQP